MINEYYNNLLLAESDHHASKYHSIEDYKKVHDAVYHGCCFGFEERQKEVDLLEKAHDLTIEQLMLTQKERNVWKNLATELNEEMRRAEWISPLFFKVRLYLEFDSLKKDGVLPHPNEFHKRLFPSEEDAGGHIYGNYEEYLEFYKLFNSDKNDERSVATAAK